MGSQRKLSQGHGDKGRTPGKRLFGFRNRYSFSKTNSRDGVYDRWNIYRDELQRLRSRLQRDCQGE